ncbi:MAG: DUF4338 domain-containing protein [Planctomycetota bacterium]|nr:DUF4338 domain-containing protein [Planctomycetota bacterium]
MIPAREKQRFCGREFTREELALIQEVVETCAGLSRTELSHTVCELLEWRRANGRLKGTECLEFLERLEREGFLKLPKSRQTGAKKGTRRHIAPTTGDPRWANLRGSVGAFLPLDVALVKSREQRRIFKDLVSRHHYLGYAMPFGARLQYLVYVSRPGRQVVGCVQFSSPAWRMKVRDRWIGWDDAVRGRGLQQIVNNSRLLVLPRIRNLASALLSCVLNRLREDWHSYYGVDPWLVETLVDRERFHGGCYRAANFIVLGETSGRGRMDRAHQRHGAEVKTVMVYPLVKHAARRLRESHGG